MNGTEIFISLLVAGVGALTGILFNNLKEQLNQIQSQQTFQLGEINLIKISVAVITTKIDTFNSLIEKTEKHVETVKEKVEKFDTPKVKEQLGKVTWLEDRVRQHENIHRITKLLLEKKVSKDGR